MFRIQRKNRTYKEINYISRGEVFDMFDNELKTIYRLNDKEYDHLCENMSDQECSFFLKETMSYREKREVLCLLDKYLTGFVPF